MAQELWDGEADTFDDEPDHGLTDPVIRAAWRELLLGSLPPAPSRVADLGCGTGTLTRLLTDEGYTVDGLDLSPEMIRRARVKVPEARFLVGDAFAPALASSAYEVVLSRHVLWAMPDPVAAFARWVDLLKPEGIVVLVEGRWESGVGLTADEAGRIVRTRHPEVAVRPLPEAVYWGKEIDDERYLLVSSSGHRPSDLQFSGVIWEWRGPAPYYFVTVPEQESLDLLELSADLTYGWGMIPVRVRIGGTEWETSLWPKDGGYVVPLKDAVRRAEGLHEGDTITVELIPAPRR